MTARHDKATYCTCPEGADGNPCVNCGKPESITAPDKATEGRAEAAAVAQAIADVETGLAKGCTCGKTNHDLRGFDIDAYHDENDCRLCAALAALRVLADAVEELREDVHREHGAVESWSLRAEAVEAERDAWREKHRNSEKDWRKEWLARDRLARQVADLEAALRRIEAMAGAAGSGETPAQPLARIARAALAAARSRDPQEPTP